MLQEPSLRASSAGYVTVVIGRMKKVLRKQNSLILISLVIERKIRKLTVQRTDLK